MQIPEGEIQLDEHGNYVMAPSTFTEMCGGIEEVDDDEMDKATAEALGRKDYCCHNNADQRCKKIRASSTASAILKCFRHWPSAPKTVHRGTCNHG